MVRLFNSEVLNDTRVTVLARAKYQSFYAYLRTNDLQADAMFKSLVFQVAFTLQNIFDVYPMFRHNDLKLSNVLIVEEDLTNRLLWESEHIVFSVKSAGIRPIIIDFDASCISGLVDNYKAIDLSTQFTSMCIGTEKNHKADLFRFVYELYRLLECKLSQQLKVIMTNIYGRALYTNLSKNLFIATDEMVRKMPTTRWMLLESGLFEWEKSTSTRSPRGPASPRFKSGEQRRVPHILSTNVRRQLPAEAYLEQMNRGAKALGFSLKRESVDDREIVELLKRAHNNCNIQKWLLDRTYTFVSQFLDQNLVPENTVEVFIVLAFVRAYRQRSNPPLGENHYDVQEWIDFAELEVDEEQFLQLAVQWAWFWRE